MFEAYKIGIRISLINKVSAGLLMMSRQFNHLNLSASELQTRLDKIRLLGMAGAGISTAGFMGLGILGKMLGPAQEYAHQLNILNMAGWTQKEIADAVGDSWKNTSNVITTTATGNMQSLLDLKNILGDFEEARMALPIVSRIQGVLAASSEAKISGNSKDLAYSMAKALDIIGAARTPERFNTEAEMMAKVIIATQGRVTPEAYKSVFQYARQAKFGLSDEFKYQILPSLIQENAASGGGGGGSRGVGPMLAAFYRWAIQGYINKKSLPELISLGLVSPNTVLKTTTKGTTVGAMRGAALASENSFQWVQRILVPALKKKYGANLSESELQFHINQIMRGNQLGANLVGEYAFKPQNFLRDQQNIIRTMNTADAYKAALSNDPYTAFNALSSQWENFKTSFLMGVVPVLIPALAKMTDMFNNLATWGRANPTLFKDLAFGFIGLSSALAFGGVVIFITAAFKGLGLALSLGGIGRFLPILASGVGALGSALLLNPIGLTLTAIGGAVYLLWKNWDTVGPFLKKIWDGIVADIEWVGRQVRSVFTGIFNFFKSILPGTDTKGVPLSLAQKSSALPLSPASSAWKADSLGDLVHNVFNPPKESPYVAPNASKTTNVHTQVNLDGRQIANVVSEHQARAASRPLSSGSWDPNMALPPAGMGYAP